MQFAWHCAPLAKPDRQITATRSAGGGLGRLRKAARHPKSNKKVHGSVLIAGRMAARSEDDAVRPALRTIGKAGQADYCNPQCWGRPGSA
ncbi:hypothetical protein NDU88_004150 [Pleurodeles waltl]|uniref:Uncharacterized protein n=1 Tax=Pleurodeles waltl TaxID=8319 RepID=A0AAV7MVM6_PLEWA|nr:hypothetical protein NDU88_004150 [Pleurodeles waltl]